MTTTNDITNEEKLKNKNVMLHDEMEAMNTMYCKWLEQLIRIGNNPNMSNSQRVRTILGLAARWLKELKE